MTTNHLLLIFRRDPPGDAFFLLNEHGLPISTTSPILSTEGKNLVVAPLLLVAVTEAVRANHDAFGGFEYLMSWTANDYKHYYVILEKQQKEQRQNQNQDQDQDQQPPSWGNDNNDSNDNGGWPSNDVPNTTSNDNPEGWASTNAVPPGSPVNPNPNTNTNTTNTFQNHAWPSDLVNLNRSTTASSTRPGGGGGGATSWSVRDWAMSPDESGCGRNGTGNGGGNGGGTVGGGFTPASDW